MLDVISNDYLPPLIVAIDKDGEALISIDLFDIACTCGVQIQNIEDLYEPYVEQAYFVTVVIERQSLQFRSDCFFYSADFGFFSG